MFGEPSTSTLGFSTSKFMPPCHPAAPNLKTPRCGGWPGEREPKTAQLAADLVHEVLGAEQQGQCICFRDRGLGRETLVSDCAVRL